MTQINLSTYHECQCDEWNEDNVHILSLNQPATKETK